MDADILHSGFDGLKFTLQSDIPKLLRNEPASAKALPLTATRIAPWTSAACP